MVRHADVGGDVGLAEVGGVVVDGVELGLAVDGCGDHGAVAVWGEAWVGACVEVYAEVVCEAVFHGEVVSVEAEGALVVDEDEVEVAVFVMVE